MYALYFMYTLFRRVYVRVVCVFGSVVYCVWYMHVANRNKQPASFF